ncbi:MAG: cadherin-like domain-containing protein, partial [Cyanobacteria bacterium Co-bin8]|nr:cadherin-like domain-containing protein [Cyanobacteria bacterium Co-bin8]
AENDAPLFEVNQLTITEGGSVVLNQSVVGGVTQVNLRATDEETDSAILTYTVTSVKEGQFELIEAGGTFKIVTEFTQGQVDAGLIRFTHRADSEIPPSYTLEVNDGQGSTAVREMNLLNPATFAVNDAPTITANTLRVSEGQAVTISTLNLDATDPDNFRDGLLFSIAPATDLNTGASLLAGQFLVKNQSGQFGPKLTFTRADILAGRVKFQHDSTNRTPQYSVTVSDGSLTSEAKSAQVAFTPINDQPIFLTNTLQITEGETVTLNQGSLNLVATDEESAPDALIYRINQVVRGNFAILDSNTGTSQVLAVGGTFTQAQVNAGQVQFTHDGSELAPSYTLTVRDAGINNNPATALGVTREVFIPVGGFVSINDAPELVANQLTLKEGDALFLTTQNLRATDAEDNDDNLVFTITGVTGGRFERVERVGEAETVEILAADTDPPTASVEFTQADILMGKIRFVHIPNTNTAPTYQVQVRDLSDPAAVDSGAATINFTPINDIPVLETLALEIAEDQTVFLNPTILNVSDEETGAADVVYTVDSVSGGQFVDANGTAVTRFTQAQVNAGDAIAFQHDGSNTAPSFTLTAADGPAAEGGQSITIESGDRIVFTPINDLPIVQVSQFSVTEGGTVKLSSALLNTIDEESTAGQLTYTVTLTQADPTKPDGFMIDGTLQTTSPVTFTQAQVNAGLVQFVHGGSNSAPQIALTVSDASTGSFNTVPVDLKIAFTATNDAPLFNTNTLSISEGGTVIFNQNPLALNLVTTDEESAPEDLVYTIDKVARGQFELIDATSQTTVLKVGDSFTQAQVNAGQVQFVHGGDELAPTYTLTVKDSGINGDSTTVRTVTREVTIPPGGFTQINDVPTLQVNTLTLEEGGTVILTSDNLQAIDPETNSAALVFTITAVTGGRFERVRLVEGEEVVELLAAETDPPTSPVSFTQEEVLLGLIRFVNDPAIDTPPTYRVEVRDLSDPAGVDSSDAVVNFTPINDVPILETLDLQVIEGQKVLLSASSLSVVDEETAAEGVVYSVDQVKGGKFVLNADGTEVKSFTQAQVNAGDAIAFQHDGSNTAPSFKLTAADEGGQTITFESDSRLVFTPTNDTPKVSVNQITLSEGGTIKLSSSLLNTTDEESAPNQLTYTAKVTNADPSKPDGFIVDGKSQSESTVTFTQAQVNAGLVQFVHGGSNSAPQLEVTVTDTFDGNPVTVPVDLKIAFNAINDVPVFTTNSLKIAEGETVIFNSDPEYLNLVATDEESSSDQLTYTIDQVAHGQFGLINPDTGTVALLEAGQTFTQAQVNAGLIQFTHDDGEAPPAYTLTLSDSGTAGDTSPKRVTKTVEIPAGGFTPINDAPVFDAKNVQPFALTEGGTVTLSNANLLATDAEGQPLTYTVTLINPPADPAQQDKFVGQGVVQVDPLTYTFTQANVSAGTVQFVHGGSNQAPQFKVTLTDTFAPADQQITIEVPLAAEFQVVNDAPVFATNTLKIAEGGSVVLNAESLNLMTTDEESGPEALTYTVDAVTFGKFERINPLTGTALGDILTGGTFTQAEVNSGTIRFVHDGGEKAPSYTLTVADTGTPGDSTPKSITRTLEIPAGDFTNVNDPPTIAVNKLVVTEGETVVLTLGNLNVTDPDSTLSRIKLQIKDVVGGQFLLDGKLLTPEASFSLSAIAFGQLSFVDDGEEGPPSYTVVALDPQGGTTSLPAQIDYTPVNDPPRLTVNSFTITEGGLLTLNDPDQALVNLQAEDDETTADQDLLFKISNVKGGRFADFLNQPVESFTQKQLNDGDIVFVHDGSETVPSFDITVRDSDGSEITEAAKVAFVPVNDPPKLTVNQFKVQEGGTVVLTSENLFASDPDTDPASLTFVINGPSPGQGQFEADTDGDGIFELKNAGKFTLAQVSKGQVRFVDDGDETPPSYTISVSDGEFATAPVAAKIEFVPVNDAPVATDDGGLDFSTNQNTKLTTPNVLTNDTDSDSGDVLTIVQVEDQAITIGGPAVKLTSGALVSLNENGTFTYDPNGAFVALAAGKTTTDAFAYTVGDKAGATDTAT